MPSSSKLAGSFPLVPVQRGIAFECALLDPHVYIAQFACRLLGPLQVESFKTAWQRVLDRHEVLRAGVVWEHGGAAVHVVHDTVTPEWTMRTIEADGMPIDVVVERLRQEERERGFDLQQPPLMRFLLLRSAPEEHWFVWTWHHIIVDGWSTRILFDEVAAAYAALTHGREPALPAPVSFRRYVDWLDRAATDDAVSFWRERLAGVSATVVAPQRRPQAAVSAIRGVELTDEESGALVRFAREHDLTLATLCYAAWVIVLARFAGQREVVFGMTVSGRDAAVEGIADIVGPTINTLPVRCRVPMEARIDSWLAAFQLELAELRAHGQLPLSDILASARLSDEPFDTVVIVENLPGGGIPEASSAPIRIAESDGTVPTHYAMTLVISPRERLAARVTYDTGGFEHAQVEAIAESFIETLRSLASSRQGSIGRISSIPPSTLRQLAAFNDTAVPFAENSIVELFEAQVDRKPDAIAVSSGTASLSYAALDALANRLARCLRREGVRQEILVGVSLDRDEHLLPALLAVLKAGGAYVPLDRSYPSARRAQILRESGAPLVIGQQAIAGTPARCIERGDLENRARTESPDRLKRPVAPNSVAYVLYTSGSTGAPKGIALTHGNAANFLQWAVQYFGPPRLARVAAVSSYCFDLSVFELFAPLVCGGRTVIVESVSDVEALRRHAPLTLLNTVPSAIALLESAGRDLTDAVSLAGEQLTGAIASQAHTTLAPIELFNVYGPSETTTYSSAHRVLACEAEADAAAVPIGGPIANTTLSVCDEAGEPAPLGGQGELYIGGAGVARGYWERPDLTAERFVPDPAFPGARRYRTGDRVRWRPDGVLEFRGRVDNQVKIRGYRIELGEIESVIAQHPDTRESAAWVSGGTVAPILAAGWTGDADEGSVRRWLTARLPRYMVPAALVRLAAMPRLPNGKLDRRQLSAMPVESLERPRDARITRDALEAAVLEIWQQATGRPATRLDSFVAAGGHSLAAMRVVSQVEAVLGVRVPLRAIFDEPSAAAFTARVAAALSGRGLQPLMPASRGETMPAAPIQQRMWFLEELAGDAGPYNVALAVRIEGALDPSALRCALDQLVDRHEVLRTTFEASSDGQVWQRIARAGTCGWELRAGALDSALSWAAEDVQRRFDLAAGPLMRALLVRVSDHAWVLALTVHHIAVDAWSLQVLWRELHACYHAAVTGTAATLPPLSVQYADFVAWQRATFTSGALDQALAYWRRQLAGVPPLELPLDRPRPAVQTFRGRRTHRRLSAQLSLSLRERARELDATLFMVMAAAVEILLARSSRQRDFALGIPAISRPFAEIDEVVGPFLNTLALRADVSGNPTFAALVARVRRVALEAYAHQDVPFERLVEELGVKRDTSRHPLFQAMLVFEQWSATPAAAPGLRVTRLDRTDPPAKFDLTFFVDASAEEISIAIEHNRDLFDDATIDAYARRWAAVLEAVASDLATPVFDVPWIDDAEAVAATAINATAARYDERPLPALFEEQVRRTPDAVAVVQSARALTYRHLNDRANCLARRLQRLGVGPDDRVGLAVDRSIESIVALLAVWKAGAAYVPLDLTHPQERLATILRDARPSLLVTTDGAAARLPRHGLTAVLIGSGPTPEGEPFEECEGGTSPDNLAYIIYSSGSTGTPKGIALPHRALSNLIAWHHRHVPRGAVVLQFASIGFDASVHEVFAAFAAGGTLVIADELERRDPHRLATLLATHQVDKVELPVVMLQRLAEVADAEPRPFRVGVVTSTGEQLRITDAIRRLFARNAASLRNHYGPSETHLATAWELSGAPSTWSDTPSIGPPIDNTRLYVLDDGLRPVPPGIAGELYIGGDGLARGYWDRSDQTAERFLPDPFDVRSGRRMYRSGDVVRWSNAGELDFLGRLDQQTKIRGCRVEPAEVEAELERHAAVGRAVVTACEIGGARQLVAYIARQGDVSAQALRNHLREHLPDYMIPALWQFIEQVPVNANGKVDHASLPAPIQPGRAEAGRLAPRSLEEARLVWMWEDVLRHGDIGVRDDFFELGGDSIGAAILVRRIREMFGRDLSVTTLFQAPTIEELARVVRAPRNSARSLLVPIQPEGELPAFFCVHPVGGGVLCYANLARALRSHCRFFGLQAPGFDGREPPLASIPALASAYIAAIAREIGDEPPLIGGWSLGGKVAYEMARQLAAAGRAPRLLALFDTEARRPVRRSPDQASVLAEMLQGRLELAVDRLRTLSDDDQLRAVLDAARQAGVITDDVDAPEARRAIGVYRSNLVADAAYVIQPYAGTVTLFVAAERDQPNEDQTLGWSAVARGGVRVHQSAGTHLTMIEDPARAAQLAALLGGYIHEASQAC